MEAEEEVRTGATKVTLKAAVKTKTNLKKVSTCLGWTGGRDSWSRAGLYWHALAGAVRSLGWDIAGSGGLFWWLKLPGAPFSILSDPTE